MNADTPVRIVHLSDLHFGREDTTVVNALQQRLAALDPLVIAISGDLTQRARRNQFRRARSFLDALPAPYLVVPGNHDVPLFNLFARLLDPLGGYHRHISCDTAPVYAHPRVLIVGMDTTRPSSVKDARIARSAVEQVREAVGRVQSDVVKILVAHHPFGDAAPESSGAGSGAADALRTLADAGVDVFLTGHLHVSAAAHSASRYRLGGRSALLVEAGTATSTRLREATNAFNVLHVTRGAITVERHDWGPSGFQTADIQRFVRTAAGWSDRIE
jgi:3',5'-cyclic AMP phosphodiesterase CpdA